MLFDFVTDAHLDHYSNGVDSLDWHTHKNESSSVLLVTGDHSNFWSFTLESLKRAKELYDDVIFVDGNHDWYGWTTGFPHQNYPAMTKTLDDIGVIHLDGKTIFRKDDVAIVGACGWYDFRVTGDPAYAYKLWLQRSNDAIRVFNDVHPDNYRPDQLAYDQAVDVSNRILELNDDSTCNTIVVATHTAPLRKFTGAHGQPAGNPLDGAYANIQMGNMVQDANVKNKVKVWCYGHTHNRIDVDHEGIRYINNGKGYDGEEHLIHNQWTMVQVDTENTPNPWLV